MKKMLYIPLALMACIGPLVSLETSHIQTEAEEHQEFTPVDQILKEYQEGKHRSFLNQIDKIYQSARKKWQYNSLLEKRKTLSKVEKGSEDRYPPELGKKVKALNEKLDRELIEFCLENPHLNLSKALKEMVFFTASSEEQASLNFIEEVKSKFEGDGKSPLENKLIAIDTEFWLKSNEIEGELINNKMDTSTYITKDFILQLEKLSQMQIACEQETNAFEMLAHIKTALSIFPKTHRIALTKKHLLDLAKEKAIPESQEEEKLQAIVLKYHKQEKELINAYFSENQQ